MGKAKLLLQRRFLQHCTMLDNVVTIQNNGIRTYVTTDCDALKKVVVDITDSFSVTSGLCNKTTNTLCLYFRFLKV